MPPATRNSGARECDEMEPYVVLIAFRSRAGIVRLVEQERYGFTVPSHTQFRRLTAKLTAQLTASVPHQGNMT